MLTKLHPPTTVSTPNAHLENQESSRLHRMFFFESIAHKKHLLLLCHRAPSRKVISGAEIADEPGRAEAEAGRATLGRAAPDFYPNLLPGRASN